MVIYKMTSWMCVRQNLKRFEYKRDTHNIRWVTDAGQALALFWYTLYQLWHSNPRSGRCCAERNWWAMETSRLQGADYPRDDHPTAWPEKHYRTLFAQLKYWCGITESPAIEFFFFNHSLQRQKINPQRVLNLNCSSSKSASVPPSLLRLMWEALSFEQKL